MYFSVVRVDDTGGYTFRELGYTSGVVADYGYFGQGTDPIWLDNIICAYQYESVLECSHNSFGDHNCGHDEDLGVYCGKRFICRISSVFMSHL